MNDLGQRAEREGTPLIDGEEATFVWQGDHAPRVVGDFNSWGANGAGQLTETQPGLWTTTVKLPRDGYFEYTYAQHEGLDPLNHQTVRDGLGHVHNYFLMPDHIRNELIRESVIGLRGRLTHHVVRSDHLIVGGSRNVTLYHPPTDDPCPLLVVLDGQDYLPHAHLPAMVDNLIAEGRIEPIALALVDHGGPARFVEYCCNDSTLSFLLQEVLPLAREELTLVDPAVQPGAFGILGASMGGLMALYAGLRFPAVFGRVLSQSGGFGLQVGGNRSVIFDLVQRGPVRPLQIWMDVGRYEWLLSSNREMRSLLKRKKYRVTYREYNGSHNYTCWRDDIWHGLEILFPPSGRGALNEHPRTTAEPIVAGTPG